MSQEDRVSRGVPRLNNTYSGQEERYIGFIQSSFSWEYFEKPAYDRLVNPLLNHSTRVLDAGCGPGRIVGYLSSHGVQEQNITAIDPNEQFLSIARQNYPEASYILGSIADSELHVQPCDVITCSMVLQHLDDNELKQALENFNNWLTPGGTLFFMVSHPVWTVRGDISKYSSKGWIAQEPPWGGDPLGHYYRSVSDYLNAVLQAQFSITGIAEPVAPPESKNINPDDYIYYAKFPPRLAITAKKDNISADREGLSSGTAKNMTKQETVSLYIGNLNRDAYSKAAMVLEYAQPQEGQFLVDVGCMTGEVLSRLKAMVPGLQVEGVDVNQGFIDQARKQFPELRFQQGDLSKGLPHENEVVDTFTVLSVLHEIYTYNGFSTMYVIAAMKEMHRALKQGGKIVIREPVMPTRPDEVLRISLSKDNGVNPATEEDLLRAHPKHLSARSMMRRFLLQYEPLALPQNQQAANHTIEAEDGSYELPAWLVGEFLRKRTFTDTRDLWNSEMREQNAAFTSNVFAMIAEEAGFNQANISIREAFEENFYGELTEEDGIRITDLGNNTINQRDRFPSHLYAVLEKM